MLWGRIKKYRRRRRDSTPELRPVRLVPRELLGQTTQWEEGFQDEALEWVNELYAEDSTEQAPLPPAPPAPPETLLIINDHTAIIIPKKIIQPKISLPKLSSST